MTRTETRLVYATIVALVGTIVLLGSRHKERRPPLRPSPVAMATLLPLSQPLRTGPEADYVFQAIDYECQPCHGQEPDNQKLRSNHPGLNWYLIQFPLSKHRSARPLALMAMEANSTGTLPVYHASVMSQLVGPTESIGAFLKKAAPGFAFLTNQNLESNLGYVEVLRRAGRLPVAATPTYFVFRKGGASTMASNSAAVDAFLHDRHSVEPDAIEPCADDTKGCGEY